MSGQNVTVDEALQNVELLEMLPIVDEQPCIEPMPAALSYIGIDKRGEIGGLGLCLAYF